MSLAFSSVSQMYIPVDAFCVALSNLKSPAPGFAFVVFDSKV